MDIISYSKAIQVENELTKDIKDVNTQFNMNLRNQLDAWEKGSITVSAGIEYSSDTQIRSTFKIGMSTGVSYVRSNILYMYVLAWDLNGNYIGFYNSEQVFSKANEKYKTWKRFDCSKYPQYVFRFVAQYNTPSSSITPEDGKDLYCISSDKTELTDSYFSQKINKWSKGSMYVVDGSSVTSNTQIRTEVPVGISTGVRKITSDGVTMYILAWDLQGNYVGFYNSNEEFSKATSNYATWTEFDCSLYPDYVFRITAQFNPSSSSITIGDGQKVTFHNVLDKIRRETKTIGNYHKIVSNEMESGYYGYSTKLTNAKRLRNKEFFIVKNGMDIHYTNPTCKVYFGVLGTETSNSYLQVSGWIDAGETDNVYHISNNGYLVFLVESTSDISPSGYDCDVEICDELFYRKEIDEGRKDLFKLFQRVGVIGDSISVGYIDANYPSRNLMWSWPKCIMRDAGVPWLNFGTSGQTTLTWASDNTYGKVQMEADNNKCQAYLICLGCNDEWDTFRHVDLGTTSDVVDDPTSVATTYYGGYNRIIQLLKQKNPDCKIFCVTNPVATESLGYNNAVRWLATEHYDAEDGVFLLEIAKKYRRVINNSDFGIYADRIGVHYSPYGYRMIATLMEKALNEVIRNNMAYFADIASVTYDTGTPTANTMTE